jgi:phosphatidate cytidylyltransferase
MTKPKKDVKFAGRERRMSRSDSPSTERTRPTHTGAKSPTRNGGLSKMERPDYNRQDTGMTEGWATEDEKAPEPKEQSDFEKKKQTFIVRTIWTIVMIGMFFGAMFAGHIYMIIIITGLQLVSFNEVIAISNVPSRARSLRFTKTLNWYFLGTVMYFLYGETVIYYFKHIVLVDKVLLPFATHHRFISFMLYVMGMCAAEYIRE